ncbi:B3 domain-containing protein REM1-like [Spinacia oleracea]|uniref:B3 domain-containing protein REM1-like n=1 Tax=Spinacia oleracea TaxID=3562 RepID=A0A9R0K1C3_SPIOL|nr:B3 domain-containing protein REM1-like [Spinacia oleracea]
MANTPREWHIAIWRAKEFLYIGAGWEHFVDDLHLREGDVLYFYYAGLGVFHVRVYNTDMVERFFEEPAEPVDVEEAAIGEEVVNVEEDAIGVEVVDVEVAPIEVVVDVENVTEEAAIGEASVEEVVHVEDREEAVVKYATRG